MILNNEKKVAPVQQKPDLQQSVNQSQIQPPSQISKSHIVDQINGAKAEQQLVSKTQVAGRSGSPPINQIKQPTGAKKFDFNDPNMDPSQLKAKDMNFKMTEEEERRYQELINGKMKKQKQTDEEIQQQMEQVLKSRPAEFQLDLIEQEAANLIISNTKFPVKPFNFEEFSGILTSLWTKDDNKPAELTGKQMASDEYANLTKDGIPEMVIRLLFSKNLEHVREGVRFIDACIKNDQRRWAVAAMWAVKIVHQQPNQAMLAVCQWLYSRIQLWEVELLFLVYYVSNYILKYFATSNADDKFQQIISSWRLFMNYSLTQEGQKYDFDRIRPQSTIQSRYLIFQKGKIEITTCNKRTAMTKINAVEDVQGRSTNSLNKLRQF
ncbi:Glycine- [Hexamita inflata]|uniref:Glutamate n=1 Tax=Hexamita inflata TaxID=28002 RepID=A0AA86Q4Z1_9EUKA|nr:Glycine- [Hexamita inflata]